MNITDVGHLSSDADTGEDKMLKGAKRENKSVMEIAQYYTDAFMADCAKLNIAIPEIVQPATGCIPEFITMVEGLLEKGFAYIAGGNVYFDTSKLDKYYVMIMMPMIWIPVFVMALKRIPTSAIRTTLFCGLPSPSLKIRH